ncbi:MAG TPA: hypothetical protein VHB74_02480 [Devosia sp.]|nr:hypothetical protein [Devosia sp.]
MKVKLTLAVLAICGALAGAAPAQAAGCISGAIVGGVAAHVTHHSTILGALGGCIVGKVVAHYTGGLTFQDVTGKMLGDDSGVARLANAKSVNIVKVSTLKGYKRGQVPVPPNAAVTRLDNEVAASDNLASAIQNAGYKPSDVLAVSAKAGGVVFVNA